MVLAFVITILIISLLIEKTKAAQWRRDKLKEKPNHTNTYLDYYGMERDRKTGAPRFIGTDISGDMIMYNEKHTVLKNLSKDNEKSNMTKQLQYTKGQDQKAIELDFLPSERNKYHLPSEKKYKDIRNGLNYIIIKGNPERGMDLAHYYYDYENRKVIAPSDGFTKRFNDIKLCKVKNMLSGLDLSWQNVIEEMILLQNDISKNGLDWKWICAKDDDYFRYFAERMRY